jgi:hypothetical protein
MPVLRYAVAPQSRPTRHGADPHHSDVLFEKYDLMRTLDVQRELAEAEVDAVDPSEFAAPGRLDEIVGVIEAKYLVDLPTFNPAAAHLDERPVKERVPSRTWGVGGSQRDTVEVEALEVRVHIPVDGDPQIFETRPPVRYMYPNDARGTVGDRELVLTYRGIDLQPHAIRKLLEEDVARIRQRLAVTAKELETWNRETREAIRERLGARARRVGALSSALGLPVRKRAGRVEGYDGAAAVRRTIRPGVGGGREPRLDEAMYDDILEVLARMSRVMERAPSAFATMDEETLRWQFLIPLNVLYESEAHAEAFNFEGKTDILLRVGGRSVFVAECKIWEGEAALGKAVDQLLGYATWRDTKTALLVFNRNRDFSAVLRKITAAVTRHSAYVRTLPYQLEGGSRYVLCHRDDPERELTLTVLAFEVPTARPPVLPSSDGPQAPSDAT